MGAGAGIGVLRGQVALVFGAGSGIGRATALAFAGEGAAVGLASRTGRDLATLADEIGAGEGTWLQLPTDVADRGQVDRAVAETVDRFGRLDVVVNSAGVNTQQRRMAELPESEWRRIQATNLDGAFHVTQAALDQMRSRGGGLIVHIASASGRWGDLSGAAYQASKHGIVGLCQATMFEERENGIRMTAILPGLTDTPMPMRRPTPPPRSLLDQAMGAEDVARACVFLASLPARTYVPELIMLPGRLQVIGQTAI
jgi:NAD(P)-dependent dehydrogenase (short-subunit alcohol dehydrogenase family)